MAIAEINVAQKLLDELEKSRVGNPGKTVTQVQITPALYEQLLVTLGAPPDFGDKLTVQGIPVVVLSKQPGEFIQLVYGPAERSEGLTH